eukprot:TRINITY_DN8245_c0_g1_i1.p1 TRINITY_DN8245_c0_g1~~TRINITY_DN8245_c0_g1_i1.p1  ORF type:complete len:833 (-),score=150.50 TRINITY_DN8245_c0_g1_i1:72-2570(-)
MEGTYTPGRPAVLLEKSLDSPFNTPVGTKSITLRSLVSPDRLTDNQPSIFPFKIDTTTNKNITTDPEPGLLIVQILEIDDPNPEWEGYDCYAICCLGKQGALTEHSRVRSSKLLWDESFNYILDDKNSEKLEISVRGVDIIKKTETTLDSIEISLTDLEHFVAKTSSVPLTKGSILLKFRFITFGKNVRIMTSDFAKPFEDNVEERKPPEQAGSTADQKQNESIVESFVMVQPSNGTEHTTEPTSPKQTSPSKSEEKPSLSTLIPEIMGIFSSGINKAENVLTKSGSNSTPQTPLHTSSSSGTISPIIPSTPLNKSQTRTIKSPIQTPAKFSSKGFYDRYGFLIQSEEAYKASLDEPPFKMSKPQYPRKKKGARKIASREGIGYCYKVEWWQNYLFTLLKLKKSPFPTKMYHDLLKQSPNQKALDLIKRDINRTFPEHPVFKSQEGQKALYNVLYAFSIKYPTIGYTQGMNFVAGYLLLMMEEELAFKFTTVIAEFLIPGYYCNNFPDLRSDVQVIINLVQDLLPDLYQHLVDLGISYSLNTLVTKWLIRLFINILPMPCVLAIWDNFFCRGSVALVVAAYVLIAYCEKDILACTTNSDVLYYMDKIYIPLYDWRSLLERMHSRPIEFKRVQEMQKYERENMNQVIEKELKREQGKNFTEEELEEIFSQFIAMAKYNAISKADFCSYYQNSKFSERFEKSYFRFLFTDKKICERLFEVSDKQKMGIIMWCDYCDIFTLFTKGKPRDRISFVFKIFDEDGDNVLNEEELCQMFDWQYKCLNFDVEQCMVMAKASAEWMCKSKQQNGNNPVFNLEDFEVISFRQPVLCQIMTST